MIIYVFIFALTSLFSYFVGKTQTRFGEYIFKIITLLILLIPAGIRYGIGTDYFNYLRLYDQYASGIYVYKEAGWGFLNNVVINSNGTFQIVIFISALITYVLLLKAEKKDFFIIIFVFVIYLYTSSFNIIRNIISVSFGWYGYLSFIKKERIRAYGAVYLGSLFHGSALLYVFIFVCAEFIKLKKRTVILLALFCVIVFKVINLNTIFVFLANHTSIKWLPYLTSSVYGAATQTQSGMGVLLRTFMLFLSFTLVQEDDCSKREYTLLSLFFLAIWCSELLYKQIYIFYRLIPCFYIYYIGMFKLLKFKGKTEIELCLKVGVLLYSVVFVFLLGLQQNLNGIIPYASIFD